MKYRETIGSNASSLSSPVDQNEGGEKKDYRRLPWPPWHRTKLRAGPLDERPRSSKISGVRPIYGAIGTREKAGASLDARARSFLCPIFSGSAFSARCVRACDLFDAQRAVFVRVDWRARRRSWPSPPAGYCAVFALHRCVCACVSLIVFAKSRVGRASPARIRVIGRGRARKKTRSLSL